jgi:hypothetical protein
MGKESEYKMRDVSKERLALEGGVPPPMGPGFAVEQVRRATRMEVWGSSFDTPGADYCEFRLFDGDVLIDRKRVGGY